MRWQRGERSTNLEDRRGEVAVVLRVVHYEHIVIGRLESAVPDPAADVFRQLLRA